MSPEIQELLSRTADNVDIGAVWVVITALASALGFGSFKLAKGAGSGLASAVKGVADRTSPEGIWTAFMTLGGGSVGAGLGPEIWDISMRSGGLAGGGIALLVSLMLPVFYSAVSDR